MVAGWGFFVSCVVVQWEHMGSIQCRENCQRIIAGIYRGDIGGFRRLKAKILFFKVLHKTVDIFRFD